MREGEKKEAVGNATPSESMVDAAETGEVGAKRADACVICLEDTTTRHRVDACGCSFFVHEACFRAYSASGDEPCVYCRPANARSDDDPPEEVDEMLALATPVEGLFLLPCLFGIVLLVLYFIWAA